MRIVAWLSPGLCAFVVSIALGPSIPPDTRITLLAPIGEESLKLLIAFGVLRIWPLDPPRVPSKDLSLLLVFYPAVAGASFGVFEHFYAYGSEGADAFVFRMLGHFLFALLGFVSCHIAWTKGAPTGLGLWLGLFVAALAHSEWNSIHW